MKRFALCLAAGLALSACGHVTPSPEEDRADRLKMLKDSVEQAVAMPIPSDPEACVIELGGAMSSYRGYVGPTRQVVPCKKIPNLLRASGFEPPPEEPKSEPAASPRP